MNATKSHVMSSVKWAHKDVMLGSKVKFRRTLSKLYLQGSDDPHGQAWPCSRLEPVHHTS